MRGHWVPQPSQDLPLLQGSALTVLVFLGHTSPVAQQSITWQEESQDEGEQGPATDTAVLFCYKMELSNPKCPRTPLSAVHRPCSLMSVLIEHRAGDRAGSGRGYIQQV